MRSEDWPRVEELFHNVSRLGAAERAAYLARECAGDEALRREVESMVSASESNPSFMARPLLSRGLRALYGGAAESRAGGRTPAPAGAPSRGEGPMTTHGSGA